jgi:phenylpropionate dioxygenase-like ring-hydroxylating dioxygenase large terminal subunit
MLQAQQPVLRKFYYPVLPVSHLGNGPQSITMLGEKVVLWLDENGNPAAAIDRCCHRTAKLSGGTVENGCVVCPYHGWSFNRDGKCTYFPQSQLEDPPKAYKIKAYRCEERYGYVWVALDEPLMGIPEFKRADDPSFRQIDQFYEVIHCAGMRLMENSFDGAHVAFVHHNTFGDKNDPVPPKIKITPNAWGFETFTELGVTNKLNDKVKAINVEGATTTRTVSGQWFMPFIRQSDMTYPNGLVHSIVTCSTPIDNDSCLLVQFVYRSDTEADVPAATVIAFDRAVVDEDMAVLESTESDFPLDIRMRMETHMYSDQPGILMREMLLKLLADHGEAEATRPRDPLALTVTILEKAKSTT